MSSLSSTTIEPRAGTDPRPRTGRHGSESIVAGWRCSVCRTPRALPAPWCPTCRGELAVEDFGPDGTVWSSTVVHLAVGDLEPPYGLAYVDLDDGPRILAHVPGSTPLEVGTRVRVDGCTTSGDITVTPDDGVAIAPDGVTAR